MTVQFPPLILTKIPRLASVACRFALNLPRGASRFLTLAATILPSLHDVTIELPEYGPLCLDLRETVCQSPFLRGYYSFPTPPDIQFLKTVIAPGMTVFDIGANIGYYAKVISASLKQQGSIVCVEPMPRALVLLRKNAALCEVPISIESCAVGEVPGRAELLEKNALDVSTVVFASKSAASVRSTTVVTIDDLATKHGPPHMIKIDVEGAELIALKGAQQLLRQRDLIVMFEYIPRNADNFGGYSIEQIVAAFPSRYRVFRIGHPQNLYDYRMIGKSTLTDDYLAVPTKLLTVELATRIYAS